jgi:hypothetical protein
MTNDTRTETEQALADAKLEIESAVAKAAERLKDRTGLVVTVDIDTIDTSTYNQQSRVYCAKLQFSV